MFVNFSMQRILLFILLTTSLFAKDIIAVLELEQKGLTKQEAEILTDRLTTKLISIDKYQVVERTNMDKILKEQKFQSSGCTDSECAVEIGQLLNTDFIVIGSVSKFGSMYSLDSRLIDVAQGKGLISAEYSKIGEIEILMSEGITSIANQLCGNNKSIIIKERNKEPVSSRLNNKEELNSSIAGFNKYKPEVKSMPKAVFGGILLPGYGQFYTENNDRGKLYRGCFIYAILDLGLLVMGVEPFTDSFGEGSFNLSTFIAYGIGTIDTIVSVNKYNRDLSTKYNISLQPDLHNKNLSLHFTYNL
jgi:TolB-like protein